MATPLAFAFNQEELQKMSNYPNATKIVFSLKNAVNPPPDNKLKTFVFAHAADSNDNLVKSTSLDDPIIIDGCPFPPGWQSNNPTIDPAGLQAAVRFSLEKNALTALLATNKFRAGQNIPQIRADIEGSSANPNAVQMVLSLKNLQTDGSAIGQGDVSAPIVL